MSRLMSKETALTAAWIVALGSSLAVLYIGEVLGQAPCNLCWFQRAFMFPLAIVLSLGLWWEDHRVGRYGVALALGGAAIALWHLGRPGAWTTGPVSVLWSPTTRMSPESKALGESRKEVVGRVMTSSYRAIGYRPG